MAKITVDKALIEQALDVLNTYAAKAEHRRTRTDDCKAEEAIEALRAALAGPAVESEKLGSEWAPCMKLPVVVHVRKQRTGEQHVSTREGITPVTPDDLVMRGVSGEEYPIGRAIFEQTYTFNTSPPPTAEVPLLTPLGDEVILEKWMDGRVPVLNFAREIEAIHGIGETK